MALKLLLGLSFVSVTMSIPDVTVDSLAVVTLGLVVGTGVSVV